MLPQHNPSLCSPHLGRSSPGVVKSALGWQNPNCPECWEAPAAGEDAAGDSAGPARCSHQPSCTPESQNQSHSREKTPPGSSKEEISGKKNLHDSFLAKQFASLSHILSVTWCMLVLCLAIKIELALSTSIIHQKSVALSCSTENNGTTTSFPMLWQVHPV